MVNHEKIISTELEEAHDIWIFRYKTSEAYQYTFAMSLIAMRKSLWATLAVDDTPLNLVRRYR